MPDQSQVEEKSPKHVPGESSVKEQLEALRAEVVGATPDVDPTLRAKQIVVDNYNTFRNASKTPALTTELITIVWFNGSKMNWKAIAESPVVHGIRYEVSYNAHRSEAIINVYRKVNNVRVNV